MADRWWEAQHERFQEGPRRCVHALPQEERWSFAQEVWGGERPRQMGPQEKEALLGREWVIVREDLGLKSPFFEPQRYTYMVEGRPVQVSFFFPPCNLCGCSRLPSFSITTSPYAV